MDEQLGDLATVRLVRRQREVDLNRADQPALGKCGEQQPAVLLDFVRNPFECAARLLLRGTAPGS